MRRSALPVLIGLMGLLSYGCSDGTKAVTPDLAITRDQVKADLAKPDAAKADAAKPDGKTTTGDAGICGNVAALHDDAMNNGLKIFKGVTQTTTSTPIADIVGDMSSYKGKLVRIEGFVTEICQVAGCWAKLLDKTSGKTMSFKVTDGTYDFRKTVKVGNYAVGEGTVGTADPGPVIFIQSYGAMVSSIICPMP